MSFSSYTKRKYRRRVIESIVETETNCYIVWRKLECGHYFSEKKNTGLKSYYPLRIKSARFRVCEKCQPYGAGRISL